MFNSKAYQNLLHKFTIPNFSNFFSQTSNPKSYQNHSHVVKFSQFNISNPLLDPQFSFIFIQFLDPKKHMPLFFPNSKHLCIIIYLTQQSNVNTVINPNQNATRTAPPIFGFQPKINEPTEKAKNEGKTHTIFEAFPFWSLFRLGVVKSFSSI
jgi:hypothetical protein